MHVVRCGCMYQVRNVLWPQWQSSFTLTQIYMLYLFLYEVLGRCRWLLPCTKLTTTTITQKHPYEDMDPLQNQHIKCIEHNQKWTNKMVLQCWLALAAYTIDFCHRCALVIMPVDMCSYICGVCSVGVVCNWWPHHTQFMLKLIVQTKLKSFVTFELTTAKTQPKKQPEQI